MKDLGDRVVDDAGETVMERTEPLKVGASMIVGYLRRDIQEHGRREMLRFARTIFTDPSVVSDQQIVAIALGRATLRGYSPPGYSYHDTVCETCLGEGCEICGHDGFAPPVKKEG